MELKILSEFMHLEICTCSDAQKLLPESELEKLGKTASFKFMPSDFEIGHRAKKGALSR
jgi:hypothetical protein